MRLSDILHWRFMLLAILVTPIRGWGFHYFIWPRLWLASRGLLRLFRFSNSPRRFKRGRLASATLMSREFARTRPLCSKSSAGSMTVTTVTSIPPTEGLLQQADQKRH